MIPSPPSPPPASFTVGDLDAAIGGRAANVHDTPPGAAGGVGQYGGPRGGESRAGQHIVPAGMYCFALRV